MRVAFDRLPQRRRTVGARFRPGIGLEHVVAVRKALGKRQGKGRNQATPDGLPARSFSPLLADLATPTRNEVTLPPGSPGHAFPPMAKPAELHGAAFQLPDIDRQRMLPCR